MVADNGFMSTGKEIPAVLPSRLWKRSGVTESLYCALEKPAEQSMGGRPHPAPIRGRIASGLWKSGLSPASTRWDQEGITDGASVKTDVHLTYI